MAERASRMKQRYIFLMVHKNGQPRRCYMGSSIKQMAKVAGFHAQTLTRTAKFAQDSPDHSYETQNYFLYVAGKDDFIRGLSRKGFFSYEH